MLNKERAIKQALANVSFAGLTVSEECIKRVYKKESKNQKKLLIRRKK